MDKPLKRVRGRELKWACLLCYDSVILYSVQIKEWIDMAAEIKKEEDHNKMGTKDIFPLLMGMSLPMMLSMLVQSLYNIVDSIYVSRLGTQALTAVSLAYPLQNIVVSVAVGIGVGISSVLSISLGEKNQQRANQAATMGILLTGIHCILFVIAGILVTKPF